MLKKLGTMLALAWGAVLSGQVAPDGPYAVMDPLLSAKLFSGQSSTTTLTSLDGSTTLVLNYQGTLGPNATNDKIQVTYCPKMQSTLDSLAMVGYPSEAPWPPAQCPFLWLAEGADGKTIIVAQGRGPSLSPALSAWLGTPVIEPNRGFFLEATNLLIRTVATDLTDALFTAANAQSKKSIPVTFDTMQGSGVFSAVLVRLSQGASGLLILQGSNDIPGGSYLIASDAQALSATPLDPNRVFPVSVTGSAGPTTARPNTVQIAEALPFRPPTGPISYPADTTFSWRLSTGTAASAAVGAGAQVMTPDPSSEGMLTMWKTLPFNSQNQQAPADVRLPGVAATLSAQLSATYSPGKLEITLAEPIKIPVPGPSNLLPTGAMVTTIPPQSRLVTPAVATAGFLTLTFDDWNAAISASQLYMVFTGATTAGASCLQLTPTAPTAPFGTLVAKNDINVNLQAPQGAESLQGAVTLSNSGRQVNLQISASGAQATATMTLADWNVVSQQGGGSWTMMDSSGASYAFVFQALASSAFTTNGGSIGTFSVTKFSGYEVIWSPSQTFLQSYFPKDGSTSVFVDPSFPASTPVAGQLTHSQNQFRLLLNPGVSLRTGSNVSIGYQIGAGAFYWYFQVTSVDPGKMQVTLELQMIFAQVQGWSTNGETSISTIYPPEGSNAVYSFSNARIRDGWLGGFATDWTNWAALNDSLPANSQSSMINVGGFPLTVSRGAAGSMGFSLTWNPNVYVAIPTFNLNLGNPGQTLTFSSNSNSFAGSASGEIRNASSVGVTSIDYLQHFWRGQDKIQLSVATSGNPPTTVQLNAAHPGYPWGSLTPVEAPPKWTRVQISGTLPTQHGAITVASASQPLQGKDYRTLVVQVKSATEAYVLTTDLVGPFPDMWVTASSLDGSYYSVDFSLTAGGSFVFNKVTGQIPDCKQMLLNENFNIYGWQCSQGQPLLDPAKLGHACRMYECESTNFRRGLGGESGCGVHDNWQMSGHGPAPGYCFVVPCSDYGGWKGTGEGDQCKSVNPPSPDNGLCIWCPTNVITWAGSGYGCGVVPYLPSVHGWYPQRDISGSQKCQNFQLTSPPFLPGPYQGP